MEIKRKFLIRLVDCYRTANRQKKKQKEDAFFGKFLRASKLNFNFSI